MIPRDTPGTPTTWTMPRMPDDDVAAVRALAAVYRQLAGELRVAGQQAQAAMSSLPGAWTGDAATASAHPAGVLASDVDLTCRGLLECADALQKCADDLHRAQQKHGWSWGKVLKIGAVVVISGAVVVVSVGTAAPEVAAADGAIISAEVATAEAAVASATAARTGLSVALQSSGRLLTAVRGVAAFVRPQLPYAVGFTGFDAANQIAHTGTLDPERLALNFGINLVLPGAMASTRGAVRALPALVERPAVGVATSHVAAGGVVAGFDATRQQVLTGRVDAGQVVHAGVTGATLSSAGDLVQRLPLNWRPGVLPGIVPGQPSAGVPRQTMDVAMRDGIDLTAHEGPALGHTTERHVGKSDEFLQHRLDTEQGDFKSSFYDRPTAESAITATLRGHQREVLAFERGEMAKLPPLSLTLERPIGRVLARNGEPFNGATCTVVLRRDPTGGFVLTAFVER